MTIVPQPPTNYSLKFSSENIASGYPHAAGWRFAAYRRDADGDYIVIARAGVEVKLHGSIGAAWIATYWADKDQS